MNNQYLITKNGGYLKLDGKVSTSLERAGIYPTKKIAQTYVDKYGGEIETVYLSMKRPIYEQSKLLDVVYIVKKICTIYGLSIYGPFFTENEALEIYNSEFSKASFFPYKEELCYILDGELKKANNRLGDQLILCRIIRAKIYDKNQ